MLGCVCVYTEGHYRLPMNTAAGSHSSPAKLEGQTLFISDWAGMRPEKIKRKQYKSFRVYELYKYSKSGN